MRWSKAQDMSRRVGWRLGTETRKSRGKQVDWVFFVRGASNKRIWLCTFTNLYQMSKADFAASLAKLPQEAKTA